METWDAIRSRRDVRQFEDRPIPQEDLDLMLLAVARKRAKGQSVGQYALDRSDNYRPSALLARSNDDDLEGRRRKLDVGLCREL